MPKIYPSMYSVDDKISDKKVSSSSDRLMHPYIPGSGNSRFSLNPTYPALPRGAYLVMLSACNTWSLWTFISNNRTSLSSLEK